MYNPSSGDNFGPCRDGDAGDVIDPSAITAQPGDLHRAEIPLRKRAPLADRLAEMARDLVPAPAPESTNEVACRGEPLSSPIFWRGRQWVVTSFGVERR